MAVGGQLHEPFFREANAMIRVAQSCVVVVVAIWILMAAGCGPEWAEIQEKRKEEDAKRWAENEAKQPGRKQMIEKLISKGIFRRVTFDNSTATVWVDMRFHLLDFEAKQTFCEVVYGYLATEKKDEAVGVLIKDIRTGKTIGDYSWQWTGPGLKIY
jgi:hypothetical protein